MTEYVTTAEGIRVGYDRVGRGDPVLLIGGAAQFRAVDSSTQEAAHLLAEHGFDVVNYDRPGRGDSGGHPPFTLAGEVSVIASGHRHRRSRGDVPAVHGRDAAGVVRLDARRAAVAALRADGAGLRADAEALAWTQFAPRAELWAAVTVPTTVLIGAQAFPFIAAAAESIVAAIPRSGRVELAGAAHRSSPADLAEMIAAELRRAAG